MSRVKAVHLLAAAALGLASCASGPSPGPSADARGGASSGAAATRAPIPAAVPASSVEADRYYKASVADFRSEALPNGAVLAVKRRPGSRNSAAAIFLARTGAEDPARAGYEALFLAAEARSLSAKGVAFALALDEDAGMALELSCPAERMAEVLGLVAKGLASPDPASADFEVALKDARIAERREAGEPFARAHDEIRSERHSADFPWFPPRGTASSLATATRESVMRYWAERFSASRVSTVVVGDFEPEALLRGIAPAFAALAGGKVRRGPAASVSGDSAPALPSPRIKALALSNMPGQALVRGEFEAPEVSSPDYPALAVALAALDELALEALRGGGAAERDVLALGSARGPSADSHREFRTRLSAGPRPSASLIAYSEGGPAMAKAAIEEAIARLAAGRCVDPSTADSVLAPIAAGLEAYKARAISAYYAGCASSEGMATRIAIDLSSGGNGTAVFGMSARIREVRAEDVARVARQRLLEARPAWIALGDPDLVLGPQP